MLHPSASHAVLTEIEGRLHFVPPFFSPAAEHPELLANLWQQTKSAYLDNPLPALFKEKLAALLGRYCEVPYCLVCHTCTLHPLGMRGPAIVELLARQLPSDEHVLAAMERVDALDGPIVFPIAEEALEGIVKGHRGRVDVVSTASGGTTSFVIELPRTASSPAISARCCSTDPAAARTAEA